MTALVVRGARLFDPATQLDRQDDLYVRDGIIAGIGKEPDDFPASGAELYEADGKTLLPGLVDCRARLLGGEPEAGNLMRSETLAAAAGGITTALIPPTTDFRLAEPSEVGALRSAGERISEVRVLPICGLLSEDGGALTNMGQLAEYGSVAAGNSHFIPDSQLLLNAMKYAHTFSLTLCATARDSALGRGFVNLGPLSARLGLPVVSETAETIEVARWLLLAEQVGCRLHFATLSTARALEMVLRARRRGQPVTADVPIHNLLLTDACIADYSSAYHLMPPLRTEADRQALLEGVRDGVLCISSNHRPLVSTAKYEVFGAGEPGAASIETLLSLGLGLVRDGDLDLSQLVTALTSGPAAAFNLQTGSLRVGAPADLCILDMEAQWAVQPESLKTIGENCIENGQKLGGRVVATCCAGNLHRQQ